MLPSKYQVVPCELDKDRRGRELQGNKLSPYSNSTQKRKISGLDQVYKERAAWDKGQQLQREGLPDEVRLGSNSGL